MEKNNYRMRKGIVRILTFFAFTWGAMEVEGRSVEDAKPPREFALLPADVKTNICWNVLKSLLREGVYVGLVQMFPEDTSWESWKNLPYDENDFSFMSCLGFRPTHVIRTFEMCAEQGTRFETNRPAYFQLRNPSDWERLGRTRWVGGCCRYAPSVVEMSTKCLLVFFERLKRHEWNPEDTLAIQTVCERPVTDWPNSVRELWRTSAYGIISNCVFSVDRRHGLPNPTQPMEIRHPMPNGIRLVSGCQTLIDALYRSARFSESWNPLIELSEREATEIVYLTALCRGRVRTMDEFNAAFVPEDETFLVRLTVPECETEIGRMLYDLARKRGLFGRKEAWK